MKSSRLAVLLTILAALSMVPFSTGHTSPKPVEPPVDYFDEALLTSYHGVETTELSVASKDDLPGGIREEIPSKYVNRYQAWKDEFLSTEAGRSQWESYQNNSNFTLNIIVTRDNAEGATTGHYKWNDAGQLVAATITLGVKLDEGYPNPIYFPVMNSLIPNDSTANRVSGATLAATKLAHEFGHVNRTTKVDSNVYQLQSQLIPQYNKIFLSNGRDPNDPRLLELSQKIGGTPVQIWEDREYWGEANAMTFLRDRVTEESLRCNLFNKIRHSVDLYAKDYEPRFLEIARATPTRKVCGW
jgi:YD repeat-containing protein